MAKKNAQAKENKTAEQAPVKEAPVKEAAKTVDPTGKTFMNDQGIILENVAINAGMVFGDSQFGRLELSLAQFKKYNVVEGNVVDKFAELDMKLDYDEKGQVICAIGFEHDGVKYVYESYVKLGFIGYSRTLVKKADEVVTALNNIGIRNVAVGLDTDLEHVIVARRMLMMQGKKDDRFTEEKMVAARVEFREARKIVAAQKAAEQEVAKKKQTDGAAAAKAALNGEKAE